MFNFDPSKTLVGWLIRHGELKSMSIWDAWGNYTLSPEGVQQAERAAQWLSFDRIGRVVCSDVPRTIQTANCIMEMCSVECPYLGCDPNLRPWFVGPEFQGKEKTPERVEAFKKYVENPDLVIPDGESRNQLHDRIQVIKQYLATPYKGLPTAAVIHNSVMKSLLGIDDIKDAVDPGGIIRVWMTEKGEFEYEVVLGAVQLEEGVS
jgi:broad specificity phosphatase PhoE